MSQSRVPPCEGAAFQHQECCFMRLAWRQLLRIEGAVSLIVHGPRGCGNDHPWPSGCAEDASPCTNLSQSEVVMGGEAALERKIRAVHAARRPQAVFVLGTCVSQLIGDDLRAVAARAEARCRVPVVALATSGLAGAERGLSSALVWEALAERFMKPGRRVPRSVNFIGGSWPDDEHLRDELGRHLAQVGLSLRTMLTGRLSLAQLAQAPRAALNVVAAGEGSEGRLIGELMQRRFGQPALVVPVPWGIAETTRLYRGVADFFGAPLRIRALIESWGRRWRRELGALYPTLRGRTAAVLGSRQAQLAQLLTELGLRVTLFSAAEPGPDESARLSCLGVRWKRLPRAAAPALADFDIVCPEDPRAAVGPRHRRNAQMASLSQSLLYSGALALARALELEFQSGFFRDYGSYLPEER